MQIITNMINVLYYGEGRHSGGYSISTYALTHGSPMSLIIDPDRWFRLNDEGRKTVLMNQLRIQFPEVTWIYVSPLEIRGC